MERSTVALAHDYLLVLRGAERTFLAMAETFPDADVHTLLYDEEGTGGVFRPWRVRTSALQRFGVRQNGFRSLLPLFPPAAERMGTDDADVVVSSSSAFAHAAPKRAGAVHVCYCHSPFRYVWHEQERGRAELPVPLRPAFDLYASAARRWDRTAADGVDLLLANSRITQERIADFWGRESTILLPPVDVDRMHAGDPEEYVLSVGELVPHKGTELALRAARRAGVRMKVVGAGPERERLEAHYGDAADFLGRVDDDELTELYAHARAFVLPNVEEFGIAAVEAQAAGAPVVAAAAGGALETVVHGRTGWHVAPGEVDAFAEALQEVDGFDRAAIRTHAERFGRDVFQRGLREAVASASGRAAAV